MKKFNLSQISQNQTCDSCSITANKPSKSINTLKFKIKPTNQRQFYDRVRDRFAYPCRTKSYTASAGNYTTLAVYFKQRDLSK